MRCGNQASNWEAAALQAFRSDNCELSLPSHLEGIPLRDQGVALCLQVPPLLRLCTQSRKLHVKQFGSAAWSSEIFHCLQLGRGSLQQIWWKFSRFAEVKGLDSSANGGSGCTACDHTLTADHNVYSRKRL